MSSGHMSFWAKVLLGKRPSGQMSSGQMSFWANKCLSGQMSSGQMSSGQMSFWANVSGQMSYGQMSGHPQKFLRQKKVHFLNVMSCSVDIRIV
jgi:hypothetical protein